MQRAVAAFVLICFLAGCSSWRAGSLAPQHLIANRQPKQVRIVLSGNVMVVLNDPRVEGQHIVGWDVNALAPRSVPLADVKAFETWSPDGGKTALLVVGIVGGLAVLAFVAIRTVLYDDS